jgi:riboflavin biosynthesis pyrimidine reductase
VRSSMVGSLDGAAAGADGLSGSVSGGVDRVVLSVLRGLADVVLVGAGTARAERYGPLRAGPEFAQRRLAADQWPAPALAFVTRSGTLPDHPALFTGPDAAWVVTCAAADVEALRRRAGERVLVAGESDVDPAVAVAQLAARGMRRVLLEGGPRLLGRALAAGRVDELCLSVTPLLAGGDGPRVAVGPPAGLRARVAHLVECEGTLLGRWYVQG